MTNGELTETVNMKHGIDASRKSAFSPSDGTLTITEASEFLLLGEDSVRALVESGELPALKLNPKHLLILESSLLAFIRDRVQAQTLARESSARRAISNVQAPSGSVRPISAVAKDFNVTQNVTQNGAQGRPGRARNPIPSFN
jgi:excisionase family DNA binding protein